MISQGTIRLSMNTKLRPFKWVIVLLVCTGFCSLPFLFKLWIDATEARRWEEMRVTVEELARQVQSEVPSRPVLRGGTQPGNAWEDYEAALRLLTPRTAFRPVRDFLDNREKADRAAALRLVELYAPALIALKRGASKGLGSCNMLWEDWGQGLPAEYNLTILASCRARFLKEEGRAREAAELLLDALQFGEDAARSSPARVLEGIADMHYPLEELKNLVLPRALGPEDLSEVARELELLDRNLPIPGNTHYLSGALENGRAFLDAGGVEKYLEKLQFKEMPHLPTWRYGFSERIMMVDAFQHSLEASRTMSAAAGKPWREVWDTRLSTLHDLERCGNPIVRAGLEIQMKLGADQPSDALRERRAQLRLLRMAAHFRLTGEVMTLEDPFGDRLHHSVIGNHLKGWSVGPDGRDDGGIGGWTQSRGRDIVVEVDR
jgi:hypothetical protein